MNAPFTPTRKAAAGWTVERQKMFILHLSSSGSVTQAAAQVGLSVSSAYRLRARPCCSNFVYAWDKAIALASRRLLSVAMDRALHGSKREYWRDGKLVAEIITPSDKLLMWIISSTKPNNMARALSARDVFDTMEDFHDMQIEDNEIPPIATAALPAITN